MVELWDAYDNKFNRIQNITLVRGETIEYKWVDRNYLLEIEEREIAAERTLKLIKGVGA